MKRFKTFLTYSWHYYLIYALIIIIIWPVLFNIKSKPKREEEVNIFISAYQVEIKALEKYLEAKTEGKIKNIHIDYAYYQDNFFNYIFLTRGLTNSDLIIINENNLQDIDFEQYYVAFEEKFIEKYLDITKEDYFLKQDDNIYGILLYELNNPKVNILADYIIYNQKTAEEKFYLLINRNSVYFKNLEQSDADNNALKIIQYILAQFLEEE